MWYFKRMESCTTRPMNEGTHLLFILGGPMTILLETMAGCTTGQHRTVQRYNERFPTWQTGPISQQHLCSSPHGKRGTTWLKRDQTCDTTCTRNVFLNTFKIRLRLPTTCKM